MIAARQIVERGDRYSRAKRDAEGLDRCSKYACSGIGEQVRDVEFGGDGDRLGDPGASEQVVQPDAGRRLAQPLEVLFELRADSWNERGIYEATALIAFFNFSGRMEAAAGSNRVGRTGAATSSP